VAVGVPAMTALLDPKANADTAGRVYRLRGELWDRWPHPLYGVALLHPAGIARGNWGAEPFQILSLERARWIADRGEWPLPSPHEPPPGAIIEPTLLELIDWWSAAGPEGVAVDIETAGHHLVCIGFARIRDLASIVVHILDEQGQAYWSDDEWPHVRNLVADILADPAIPKVFHNGQAFDVLMLERAGFPVAGFTFDTLLAQHIAYAEMPKGLQHCARLYNGAEAWKHLINFDDVGGDWK